MPRQLIASVVYCWRFFCFQAAALYSCPETFCPQMPYAHEARVGPLWCRSMYGQGLLVRLVAGQGAMCGLSASAPDADYCWRDPVGRRLNSCGWPGGMSTVLCGNLGAFCG